MFAPAMTDEQFLACTGVTREAAEAALTDSREMTRTGATMLIGSLLSDCQERVARMGGNAELAEQTRQALNLAKLILWGECVDTKAEVTK